jgi:hypothetical protein
MITRNYFKVVRVFPDPSDYFYIKNESLEENQVGLFLFSTDVLENMNLEYSFDKVNWTRVISDIPYIYIPADSYVYLRNTSGTFSNQNGNVIAPHENISIGGDIRTLLDYTDVGGVLTIPQNGFYKLFAFQNDSTLTDISNLSFGGITTVGDYGMSDIFQGCSLLTTAPDLSSLTSVGTYGMSNMFRGCSLLTTAPDLSSLTSVGEYGMAYMFEDCSSLTTGSDLRHLTSVGEYGLAQIYDNCNNLTSAYAPNVSTWESNKTNAWLDNVASTGVLYKPANLTIPTGTSSGVPSGWTTQTYPNA